MPISGAEVNTLLLLLTNLEMNILKTGFERGRFFYWPKSKGANKLPIRNQGSCFG